MGGGSTPGRRGARRGAPPPEVVVVAMMIVVVVMVTVTLSGVITAPTYLEAKVPEDEAFPLPGLGKPKLLAVVSEEPRLLGVQQVRDQVPGGEVEGVEEGGVGGGGKEEVPEEGLELLHSGLGGQVGGQAGGVEQVGEP